MKRLFYILILLCVFSEFSFAQKGKWGRIGPGETYFILQYRANVRVEPSLNSPVVAVLSLGSVVEILEVDTYDVINDYFEDWYKIR